MHIRTEKIRFFEKCLTDFFRKAGRVELPWRKKNITAYEVWVSEIMLQQTQVVRVISYYKNFLKRFPAVESLARVSWEKFLPYYEGLGYYERGRNMLRAAEVVVSEYQGKFPRDKERLQTLPGIGPYTASAIMSFAYGDNHLAWDTNLKRVIGRFFLGGKHLITDEALWDEKFITPKKIMNAALMDFGSALCTARPKCGACPLRTHCVYFKEGGKQEVIVQKRKNSLIAKDALVYLFLHEKHVQYFSSHPKKFEPFVLPPSYTTRSEIKQYFQEKYALTLSVRPPHSQIRLKKKRVVLVNAQILLGEPQFTVFPKSAVARYNESAFLRNPSEKIMKLSS